MSGVTVDVRVDIVCTTCSESLDEDALIHCDDCYVDMEDSIRDMANWLAELKFDLLSGNVPLTRLVERIEDEIDALGKA